MARLFSNGPDRGPWRRGRSIFRESPGGPTRKQKTWTPGPVPVAISRHPPRDRAMTDTSAGMYDRCFMTLQEITAQIRWLPDPPVPESRGNAVFLQHRDAGNSCDSRRIALSGQMKRPPHSGRSKVSRADAAESRQKKKLQPALDGRRSILKCVQPRIDTGLDRIPRRSSATGSMNLDS